ncbi:DUF1565 domain-containing protein [Pleionea sediminis]|uniref:DUF1565 domain-containing protein n=1 Tax=Pleionea sediminis TaxID=2569479 RepID=UPI00118593AB|nr:DUF1565 domain-containing protein [Pleionea sediminis]
MKLPFRFMLAMIILIVAGPLFAATYYVDNQHESASDANSGSESSPWLTIQKAANTVQAGDTVIVKEGVYTELSNQSPGTDVRGLKPQNSGTANAPIIYQANPGDSVIIDQSNGGIGFYISGRSYITVKGFIIRNIRGRTDFSAGIMTAANASHITLEDNIIFNIDGIAGANVAGIRFDNTTFSTARNNLIHNVTVDGVSNQNASAITSFGMEDVIIEKNTMYNAYNGVYHKRSSGGTGALIRFNIIHTVTRGLFYDVAGTGNAPHVNQRITQNVIYGVKDAIRLDASDASGVNDGFHVWNNTITADGSAIWIENVKNANIYNNLVFGPLGKSAFRTGPTNAQISELNFNNYHDAEQFVLNVFTDNEKRYNSFSSWKSSESFDQNSTNVDPVFVDKSARNYRLSPDSPLIGAGKEAVTIGAYITGREEIGYVGKRPKTPTGVSVE